MPLKPLMDTPERREFWKFVASVKLQVQKEKPFWEKDVSTENKQTPRTKSLAFYYKKVGPKWSDCAFATCEI